MKKHASKIFIVILFLAGLSLLLYPFAANQWKEAANPCELEKG